MVRIRLTLQKSAFTMIELIFAIVIIGITVISLPMMTQATSKGMESNLAQEAIFAASAELNQALSYKWDRNSRENPGELSKVIHTSASDCNITNGLQRPGHVHRLCLNNDAITPTVDATVGDWLDGKQVSGVDIFEAGTISDASGYKEQYTMDIDVATKDFDSSYSTGSNMKEVKVSVKKLVNSIPKDYVLLRTYSANIGETEAAKRRF